MAKSAGAGDAPHGLVIEAMLDCGALDRDEARERVGGGAACVRHGRYSGSAGEGTGGAGRGPGRPRQEPSGGCGAREEVSATRRSENVFGTRRNLQLFSLRRKVLCATRSPKNHGIFFSGGAPDVESPAASKFFLAGRGSSTHEPAKAVRTTGSPLKGGGSLDRRHADHERQTPRRFPPRRCPN